MQFFVGLTDYDWYRTLMANEAEEANFWKPGETGFRSLPLGGLFLFKLKKPRYAIVGGGHFVRYLRLPVSVAWDAFKQDNGVQNQKELLARTRKLYHGKREAADPDIGCIVLNGLFFWDESDWIEPPVDWAPNIVSGKRYDAMTGEGARVWSDVRARLEQVQYNLPHSVVAEPVQFQETLGRTRLGQGAFRALVTDAYDKRCAITGERTLPVLQAAHIRPVTREGTHSIQNGLLLRSDLHILFDQGLITVDPNYHVHVSEHIRERYSNGKDYYALQHRPLAVCPEELDLKPASDHLDWHNRNVFLQ